MPSFRTRLSRAARALTSSSLSMALLVALALTPGCGSPGPAPDYPTPEDPALEDTEFTGVLGMDDESDEEPVEDDWVDPNAGGTEPEPEPTEKPSAAAR